MQLGPFTVPIIQCLKPPQAQPYLDKTHSSTFHLFVADGNKIGDHRQSLTDCSNKRENEWCIDYDCKVGGNVVIAKDGILHKSESKFGKEPWTIMTVHTNGTIRVQASVQKKIRTDKQPESNTFHRQICPRITVEITYPSIYMSSPALTNLMLVDKINNPYIKLTSQIIGGIFPPYN